MLAHSKEFNQGYMIFPNKVNMLTVDIYIQSTYKEEFGD